MKKLYDNIDNIYIKGDLSQLTDVVTVIDISLQKIADDTDILTNYLSKYSDSNIGRQYDKAVNTSLILRDEMYNSSLEFNELQRQIVEYQNKIYRFEDVAESAQMPNSFLVAKRPINTQSFATKFNRADMIAVISALRSYSEHVFNNLQVVNDKKVSIGVAWQDEQYTDFCQFIEDVTRKVISALHVFDEYVEYLDIKIKELG